MTVVREPYGFVHADNSRLKEVYGGPSGQVFVECMRIRPDDVESKSVILFSHPVGGGSFLPWSRPWPTPAAMSSIATPAIAGTTQP